MDVFLPGAPHLSQAQSYLNCSRPICRGAPRGAVRLPGDQGKAEAEPVSLFVMAGTHEVYCWRLGPAPTQAITHQQSKTVTVGTGKLHVPCRQTLGVSTLQPRRGQNSEAGPQAVDLTFDSCDFLDGVNSRHCPSPCGKPRSETAQPWADILLIALSECLHPRG